MPAAKEPVTEPVTFSFDNGILLTSVIDPETKQHSVCCDLCGQTLKLGIRAAGNPLIQHRGSDLCKKRALRAAKMAAKGRLLVSQAEWIMLKSCPDYFDMDVLQAGDGSSDDARIINTSLNSLLTVSITVSVSYLSILI